MFFLVLLMILFNFLVIVIFRKLIISISIFDFVFVIDVETGFNKLFMLFINMVLLCFFSFYYRG